MEKVPMEKSFYESSPTFLGDSLHSCAINGQGKKLPALKEKKFCPFTWRAMTTRSPPRSPPPGENSESFGHCRQLEELPVNISISTTFLIRKVE